MAAASQWEVVGEEEPPKQSPTTSPGGWEVTGEEDAPHEPLPEVKSAIQSVPRPKSPVEELSPIYEHPGDPFDEETVKAAQPHSPAATGVTPPLQIPNASELAGTAVSAVTDPAPGAETGIPALGPEVTQGAQEIATPGKRAKGALRLATAATEAATPLMGPAAIENPVSLVKGLGEGYLASKGAGYGAKKLGADEDTKNLVETLAFWAPGVLRSIGGFLGIDDPKLNIAAGDDGTAATVMGKGGTGAGVAVTPEEIRIGGQFRGGKPRGVTIPRGPKAAPEGQQIEPPTIDAQPPTAPGPLDEAVSAMGQARQTEIQAEMAVKGVPPPAPPAPPDPTPPEVAHGEVSQDTVQDIGKALASLPPEIRSQAILETHGTLAAALEKQGKVIGPDGQINVVDTPKAASSLAATMINDEIQRHDDAGEKAAKEVAKPLPQSAILKARASAQRNGGFEVVKVEDAPAESSNFEVVKEEEAPVESAGENDRNPATKEPVSVVQHADEVPASAAVPATGQPASEAKPSFQKGDQVVLKDGTKAEITYAHPAMSILRVKTADGRKISVGARQVKPVQPEPVTPKYWMAPKAEERPQETKYKFGSTQANIPDDSEAAKGLEAARQRIALSDVAGKGTEVGGNHLTVRYGIKGEDHEGIKKYLSGLEPFDATLGKTEKFPPSEHSDGAAVIHAPIEAPELHKINAELDKHGEFTEPSFKYRPHSTVAYVHPDKADRYVGMSATEGKKFRVNSIAIADKNGDQHEVKLEGKPVEQPKPVKPEQIAPGKVGEMKVSDLKVAPHKFQYKLGTDAEGVGTLLKEAKVFNPDLAGQISVWRDPADGKTYVVNGHHRYELAKRLGQKSVVVRHIKASDSVAARAIGAQQNIAEGRGTAIDAAKYFRDTGTTAADIEAKGISLGEATAKNGLALSKLDDAIFKQVVSGDLRPGRAVAIGEATDDHAEQKAILDLVNKKEKAGGKVNDETLRELIRLVKGSEQTQESTADLFGSREITRSLALEKAEISAHIKQQLAKDRKLFGFVAKEGRASELARAGNKIDVDKSKEISTGAAQAEEVYNKLSSRGGPISSILDESARKLADGENASTVKSDAYQRVRDEVSKTLGRTEERSAGRSEGAPQPQSPEKSGTGKPEEPVDLYYPSAPKDLHRIDPILPSDAKQVSFEVRKPGNGLPDYLRLNSPAMSALRRAANAPQFLGVNMAPANARNAAASLQHAADSLEMGRHFEAANNLRKLSDAIVEHNDPNDGLVVIGAHQNPAEEARILREELLHAVMQRRPGKGSLKTGVPWEDVKDDPGFGELGEQISDRLESATGEKPRPEVVAAEAAVDLLTGEHNLNDDDLVHGSLSAYFNGLAERSGDAPLEATLAVLSYIDNIGIEQGIIPAGEQFDGDLTKPAREAIAGVLARRYARGSGAEAAAGGATVAGESDQGRLSSSAGQRSPNDSLQPREVGSGPGALEGTRSSEGNLHSTASVGLTDEELQAWSQSKGFRYEPAGEQLGMFGDSDAVLRVFRAGPKGKEQSGLVYQNQLDKLNQPPSSPTEPFALTSTEDPKEDQPRLFGAGDLGEIIGGRQEPSAPSPRAADDQVSLFRGASKSGEPAEPGNAVTKFLREEIEQNKRARNLQSGLYDLESQYQGDVLRAVHTVEETNKELGKQAPKDYEAIYHHLEDPEGAPLTPQQDKVLDETILPLMEESNRIYEKLSGGGIPAENYVHRVVKDKGGFFDKILAGKKVTGRGNLLQKSGPQLKHRTMMALEEVQKPAVFPSTKQPGPPKRLVVAVKGGKVTAFSGGAPTDLGGLRSGLTTKQGQLHEEVARINREIKKLKDERRILLETPSRIAVTFGRRKNITEEIDKLERERESLVDNVPEGQLDDQLFIDNKGREWKFTQATTKEIEANTDLKYHHNALASTLVSYLQLRKAERGFDFIESFKSNPDFQKIAFKQGAGNPPDGWKPTDLPQLRGYSFEPHVSEVLDWYAQRLKGAPPSIFDSIGKFLRTSIFFNPLIHTPNIAVHFAVEKGLSGYLPTKWANSYRAGVKAINAVTKQNQDFLDALDAGAPLQSQREDTAKITQLFFDQLSPALENNEPWALKLAKAVGMSPVNLVKSLYKFSGKATWLTNDIAFLQAAYEKVGAGMSLKEALNQTAKHIPDYRLPVRIFNSTALAKLMSNPSLTMFGGYHYGALKSYAEMAKSAVGASEPPSGHSKAGEAFHGWELLAGVGLLTFGLYPLIDRLLRKATGDKNAMMRRAGAATLPYNIAQLLKHEKSPTEVLESVATPAAHTKTALELAVNHDLRTGRQIYDPTADWRTQGQQIGRRLAEAVSPVGQAVRMYEDEGARKRFAYGLGGISFPLHGAEKIASTIAQEKLPTKAQDPKGYEDYLVRRNALDALRKGDAGPLEKAVENGSINREQAHKLRERAKLTPLQDKVHGFTYSEAMRVYEAATPEQKQELEHIVKTKRLNLLKQHRSAEVTQ